MNESVHTRGSTDGLDSTERERWCAAFERSWQEGLEPAIEGFLPAANPARERVLVELILIDLEYRLRRDGTADIHDYLRRFPSLAADRQAVVDLIAAEFELRCQGHQPPGLADYLRRFPEYEPELLQRLGTGSAPPPSLDANLATEGFQLGRFRLEALVGHGTFGSVYRATDPQLRRTVAIKVPRWACLTTPDEIERFLREARCAARLRHPAIVAVHEVGHFDSLCYLVSDYIPGTTLLQRLRASRMPFQEAAELLVQVADAVYYAHQHGVIHRDLKPSNLLLDAEGRPHVTDFGLAKSDAIDSTLTVDGQVLGTPAYMSPEQARGAAHEVDARSDVYSLGVLLYEMLTGELPFQGNSRHVLQQVLESEPLPPRRLDERVPRDLERICQKAMVKEPPQRYATAGAFADDLRRFLLGQPVQARPLGPVGKLRRWCRRKPLPASLAALLVLSVLGGLGAVVGLWRQAEAHRRGAEAHLAEAVVQRERADGDFKSGAQALTRIVDRALEQQRRGGNADPGVLREALNYYRDIAEHWSQGAASHEEVASIYVSQAVLHELLGETDASRNAWARAAQAFHEARAIREPIPSHDPVGIDAALKRAAACDALADYLQKSGQFERSLAVVEEVVVLLRHYSPPAGDALRFHTAQANSEFRRARVLLRAGKPDEALRSCQALRQQLKQWLRAYPDTQELKQYHFQNAYLCGALLTEASQPVEALAVYQQAAATLESLLRSTSEAMAAKSWRLHSLIYVPRSTAYQRDLAATYHNIGRLQLELGHPWEALRAYRQALAGRERLCRDEPGNIPFRSDLGGTWARTGEALEQLGRMQDALQAHRRAVALLQEVVAAAPQAEQYRGYLADWRAALTRVERALAASADAPHSAAGRND